MKYGKNPPNIGKKGAVVGMVICFVAMIAAASVYTSGRMNRMKDEVAKEEAKQEETQATGGDDIQNPDTEKEADDLKKQTEEAENQGDKSTSDSLATEDEEARTTGSSKSQAVTFAPADKMEWPVSGGVILGYSMDRTVYFKTLDQYKCNPAMIIDGEPGDEVKAAVDGTIVNITEDSETGKTITMDIGNEYRTIYGQMDQINYNPGDYVEQGASLGTLAQPTKYYVEEGCNLFFKVTKDGVPVAPTDFLE